MALMLEEGQILGQAHQNQVKFTHISILVLEVKRKLEKEHPSLLVGKNERDDEDMILWFLKDRKFSVDDAITKLTKAIKWCEEFGVSNLSEESLKDIYETGKAYVHDFIDVNGIPVLVVVASKHFPEIDVFYYYYPKEAWPSSLGGCTIYISANLTAS